MTGSSAEVLNDIENPPIQSENSMKQELEKSMQQELDSLSALTESCCIYRVPERLRRGKPNAYTPQVVSIGPIHHGNKGLIAMEEHKKRYLKDFLCRTGISLEKYLVTIRDHEQELRNCYAETIGLKTDDFVKIILVDAAFIIELLLKYHFNYLRGENDRIFNKPWMLQDVWPDLRLLENQLPFFILDKLFDRDRIKGIGRVSLVDLSHHFFRSMMQIKGKGDKLKQIRSSSQLKHFVDFVRLYLTPQEQPANATVTSTPATSTTPQEQPANATVTSTPATSTTPQEPQEQPANTRVTSTPATSTTPQEQPANATVTSTTPQEPQEQPANATVTSTPATSTTPQEQPANATVTSTPATSTTPQEPQEQPANATVTSTTPQEPQEQPANATVTPTPAIAMTELHLAGVKFKVRISENLFDIKFHDGTLEIPKLVISDETEVTIRNLIAFEQCHCKENYINDYVFMMDRLVNTSEDVELLVKCGIVENSLGNNSAGAILINSLADGVITESENFQYTTICEDLNQHCKKRWNRWKANLCHKYFNTPWAGISVAAAVVVIVLTLIQTVFSGMSAT